MADLLHTSQHFHRKLNNGVAIVTRFVILEDKYFMRTQGLGTGLFLSHFLTFDNQQYECLQLND